MFFGVGVREIKLLGLFIIFGVANWFIMAGARDWFTKTFPEVNTVIIGFVIILVLIALYKFRGAIPFKF